MEGKNIIVELIPTKSSGGDIIQFSALKLDGLKLIDRFDYRLNDDLITIEDLKNIINYDKEEFTYKNSTEEILKEFKTWSEGITLLILNNGYTYEYLKELENELKFIEEYLDVEYSEDIIEKLMSKYKLEPTNHIVDLLYESLIYKNN